ncbi:MAG: DUF2878 domain-containing protein [Gammaproteobacteria bacterium]|nr:DUF2878 domain-containing protein [Gammaproteobacteria bacterium]MBU1555620.1 DUF2878 domain-containing protein [Gammaproteobacteria bacterium]MBU2069898.1 DUF2878 domain-containing protein [Gammaproteobacteria bacterium]MBU2184820.1 DUF2878 domain-containing protein [Gammaproteobacteria bacterium]MBU2204356.1 DUF2878 domain-containing protein [Gammaproteobacteria bacterium]
MTALANFNWRALIGFQLCWFALVLWQQWALLPVALYWLYGVWRLAKAERIAVLLILLPGIAIDALLVQLHVLQFSGANLLPLWLLMLWAVFALAAVEFMAKVLTRPWLAALLGGSGGPLSYWSGAALSGGALQFPLQLWSALILVVVWALIAIALGQSRRFYVKAG